MGYGAGVSGAIDTEALHNEDITIEDLRFVKPLDKKLLLELTKKYNDWYIFSDSQKIGGVASAILEFLHDVKIHMVQLT
ncbi:transketolase C-terminal domain-containing protein, partial [Aliarcobacter butzleri]